jgi:hypothetical protein
MPPVEMIWAPSYLAAARLDLQIALADLRAWLRRNWPRRRSAVRFTDRHESR